MADINLRITADDSDLSGRLKSVESGLKNVQSSLDKTGQEGEKAFKDVGLAVQQSEKQVESLEGSLGQVGKIIGGILGADIIRFGVRAFRNLGEGAVQAAGDYEQLNIAVATFLGSQEKANELLRQTEELSIRTPFTPDQVNDTAKALLTFNIEQEKVIPTLQTIGDVSAGTGKDLKELAAIYGQVASAGRLQGEQLRSFTLAGIPLLSELSKNLGITEQEVRKLVSAGEIGFADVEAAFQSMTSEGGNFFDLMNKQSETFQGRVSTLQRILATLSREFGNQLLPVLKDLTEQTISFARSLDVERLKDFGETIANGTRLLVDYGPLILKTAAAWAAFNVVNLISIRSIRAQNKVKEEAMSRQVQLQKLQIQSRTAKDQLTIARNRYTAALAASNKEEGRSIVLNSELAEARRQYSVAQLNASDATLKFDQATKAAAGSTQGFTVAQRASAIAARGKAIALNFVRTAMNAIPFLAIASGITLVVQNWQRFTDILTGVTRAQRQFIEASEEIRKSYVKEGAEVVNLFNKLRDFNSTKSEQERALKQLNDQYPEILKNYDLEKASLEEINKAQKEVTDAIFERAKASKSQKIIEEALEKEFELLGKIQDLESKGIDLARARNEAVRRGTSVEQEIERQEKLRDREIQRLQASIEQYRANAKETIESINQIEAIQIDSGRTLTEFELAENNRRLNAARRYYDEIKDLSEERLFEELRNKQLEIEAEKEALRIFLDFQQRRVEVARRRGENVSQDVLDSYKSEEDAIRSQIEILEASAKQVEEIIRDRSRSVRTAAEQDSKFIEQVRREYDKLFDQLKSIQLDFELQGLTPSARIIREAELASEAMSDLEEELKKRAKLLGQEFDLGNDFQEVQRQINLDRDKQLIELELKQREDAINRRFNLEAKAADLIKEISEEGLSIEESRAKRSIQIERQRLDEIEKLREKKLEQIIQDPSSDNEAIQAAKDALAEIGLAFEELNEKEALLYEGVYQRIEQEGLQRINQRRDLSLAEIELLEQSTEQTLTLEQDKERQRLEIQQKALEDQREILVQRFGPDSDEIKLLDAQIQLLAIRANEIGKSTNPFGFLRDALKKALQIDDEELDALIGAVGLAIDSIKGLFDQSLVSAIENNEALLAQLRERRSDIESELEKELRAQEKGYANNVESKRRELEAIKAEEERAAQELNELREKQAKREAIQSAAQTVTQLVLAGARFFQEGAKLGPIFGPILAAAAIATMISTIRSIKDAGKTDIVSAFEGGEVQNYLGSGRTDKNGRKGHRVEGTNLQLGLREFVVAEEPAQEHKGFLHAVNDGYFKNVDLSEMARKAAEMKGDFSPVFMIDSAPSAVFSGKEEERSRMAEDKIDKALAKNFRELMKYFDKRPEYVPVTKGGYIEISKDKVKKVRN